MTAFSVAVKNILVKMTLKLFQPLSVVMTMVPTLLRQLRRWLQIKKIITNAPCALQFAAQPSLSSVTVKRLLTGAPPAIKKTPQKSHRKRNNNWPMMSFIHSGSEIRNYRASSDSKLDGVQLASLHFETKSLKSKATFMRTPVFKLQIIRLVQGHWSCMPTH